jgi:hypothetical protein
MRHNRAASGFSNLMINGDDHCEAGGRCSSHFEQVHRVSLDHESNLVKIPFFVQLDRPSYTGDSSGVVLNRNAILWR